MNFRLDQKLIDGKNSNAKFGQKPLPTFDAE